MKTTPHGHRRIIKGRWKKRRKLVIQVVKPHSSMLTKASPSCKLTRSMNEGKTRVQWALVVDSMLRLISLMVQLRSAWSRIWEVAVIILAQLKRSGKTTTVAKAIGITTVEMNSIMLAASNWKTDCRHSGKNTTWWETWSMSLMRMAMRQMNAALLAWTTRIECLIGHHQCSSSIWVRMSCASTIA